MDVEVEIKEELVWLEEAAKSSHENFELGSSMTLLKEETNPELTEPGPTQENFGLESSKTYLKEETSPELTEPGLSQPVADFKDEIIIEGHTIDEQVSCFKEESR
ncbi:uncharacterized protein [Anabrus simplex]|uniref:uncharacterized protein n=1 Tax=Anabrus simplex TaxID=316456 RepID=UPI0035A3C13E